jgi:CRISPR-associated protein Csb1
MVGSQANRIEPIFAKPPYAGLIPQIIIKAGEGAAQKALNLLHAGHRAGDAIARCSPLKAELQVAFKAVQAGDFTPLAFPGNAMATAVRTGFKSRRRRQLRHLLEAGGTCQSLDQLPAERVAEILCALYG